MTKDEVLKLALEAFGEIDWSNNSQWQSDRAKVAIATLKEALAQSEQDGECKYCIDGCPACDARKLPEQEWIERERAVGYREGHRAALAQRTWVGLTDEEIENTLLGYRLVDAIDIYRSIEAKLRRKNDRND